jgi:DNA-binding XRE family transcriptional regulator
VSGLDHYNEAVRLLAESRTILRNNDETCPEADRMIAEAHVHALLAAVSRPKSGELAEANGQTVSRVSSGDKAMALTASPDAWSRLGQSLRERREALGLSRRALAEKADVSEKSIQIAEEGRVPTRWPLTIGPITRALGWEPATALQIVLTEYAEEAS